MPQIYIIDCIFLGHQFHLIFDQRFFARVLHRLQQESHHRRKTLPFGWLGLRRDREVIVQRISFDFFLTRIDLFENFFLQKA